MIQVHVETIVREHAREGIVWGIAEDGRAVLCVVAGSQRVMVAMPPEDAIQCGVGGCYTGQSCKMSREQVAGAPAPRAMLVDASGLPIGGG